MPISDTHRSSSLWPQRDSPSPEVVSGEKDACGVGFIAHLEGQASHWIRQQSLRGLRCMEHRGGCGGDADSGDGAGLLTAIPWGFLEAVWPEVAGTRGESVRGVAMVFLPVEPERRQVAKAI